MHQCHGPMHCGQCQSAELCFMLLFVASSILKRHASALQMPEHGGVAACPDTPGSPSHLCLAVLWAAKPGGCLQHCPKYTYTHKLVLAASCTAGGWLARAAKSQHTLEKFHCGYTVQVPTLVCLHYRCWLLKSTLAMKRLSTLKCTRSMAKR